MNLGPGPSPAYCLVICNSTARHHISILPIAAEPVAFVWRNTRMPPSATPEVHFLVLFSVAQVLYFSSPIHTQQSIHTQWQEIPATLYSMCRYLQAYSFSFIPSHTMINFMFKAEIPVHSMTRSDSNYH